jgi:hypothetical protein
MAYFRLLFQYLSSIEEFGLCDYLTPLGMGIPIRFCAPPTGVGRVNRFLSPIRSSLSRPPFKFLLYSDSLIRVVML